MNSSEEQLVDDFCYSMGNLAETCLAMKAELGCETFDECYDMMPELKEPQVQLPPSTFPLLVLLMLTTIVANLLVTFHILDRIWIFHVSPESGWLSLGFARNHFGLPLSHLLHLINIIYLHHLIQLNQPNHLIYLIHLHHPVTWFTRIQVIVTWFCQKQLRTPSNLHIVSLATVGEYCFPSF